MIKEKQLVNFIIEANLLKRLDDFRFKNRFPTRAGAIKWLLDWALKQKPNPGSGEPVVEVESVPQRVPDPIRDRPRQPQVQKPPDPIKASPKPVMLHEAVISPEPVKASSRGEPSLESAIQALKDQGYEVGDSAVHHEGQMRVVVRSKDRSALVNFGQELQDLAAGRITLVEITARRGGMVK